MKFVHINFLSLINCQLRNHTSPVLIFPNSVNVCTQGLCVLVSSESFLFYRSKNQLMPWVDLNYFRAARICTKIDAKIERTIHKTKISQKYFTNLSASPLSLRKKIYIKTLKSKGRFESYYTVILFWKWITNTSYHIIIDLAGCCHTCTDCMS